jgi:hypothetical protein
VRGFFAACPSNAVTLCAEVNVAVLVLAAFVEALLVDVELLALLTNETTDSAS